MPQESQLYELKRYIMLELWLEISTRFFRMSTPLERFQFIILLKLYSIQVDWD